jgi:hypothetical protein
MPDRLAKGLKKSEIGDLSRAKNGEWVSKTFIEVWLTLYRQ